MILSISDTATRRRRVVAGVHAVGRGPYLAAGDRSRALIARRSRRRSVEHVGRGLGRQRVPASSVTTLRGQHFLSRARHARLLGIDARAGGDGGAGHRARWIGGAGLQPRVAGGLCAHRVDVLPAAVPVDGELERGICDRLARRLQRACAGAADPSADAASGIHRRHPVRAGSNVGKQTDPRRGAGGRGHLDAGLRLDLSPRFFGVAGAVRDGRARPRLDHSAARQERG